MNFLDFFRKKVDKSNEMDFAVKPDEEIKHKDKFVPAISFVELQRVDWNEFAGLLKKEGVLSASYDKNPISIEYSLSKDNTPIVELTFKSKTSDSIRKIQLLNDNAFLSINGAIEAFPESQRNKDLNVLWKNLQNRIRYNHMIDTNREGLFHNRRGVRLMNEAKKMIKMQDIYDREQEFLEKYQDVSFDGFYYSVVFEKDINGLYCFGCELPQFIPLQENKEGKRTDRNPIIPFTPRTLEHCILHMTNGQKVEDGEYLDEFEKKCRDLQKYSCFESEDWDKVIEFGKEIVRRQYQAYMITGELEMN